MVEVSKPCLWMVIPCYNEEEVLSITAPLFLGELQELIQKNKIAENSKILLIDDGSRDATWQIISRMAKENEHFTGYSRAGTEDIRMPCWQGLWRQRTGAISPYP